MFLTITLLDSKLFFASNQVTYTIFAPGITSSKTRGTTFANAGAFADKKYTNIVFPDQKRPKKGVLNKLIYYFSKKKGRNINRGAVVLGNGHDVQAVKEAVENTKKIDKNSTGILFGICRGSAAIIQYLATEDASWVKGIVLDSPISDPNVLLSEHIPSKYAKLLFPKFDTNGQSPISGIKSIKNKSIKVLILYARGTVSNQDMFVQDRITRYPTHIKPVYDEFKKYGFDVEIVGYEAGHCAGIEKEENGGDRTAYIKAVQSWYKKHGFKS